MATPRSEQFDPNEPGTYLVTSRCVRRAFLWGEDPVTGRDYSHRKRWVIERTAFLLDQFCFDLGGYSILSNHMHQLVQNDPERLGELSDQEVARRALRLCPPQDGSQEPVEVTDEHVRALVEDRERLSEWRRRLGDISWFMRFLKEPIARRANKEDRVTGRFFEGRFGLRKVTDVAGLLFATAYVDLNVIRAAMAETPEGSDFTSIQQRIEARWLSQAGASRPEGEPQLPELVPIGDLIPGFDLDRYLAVVDLMGREIKQGKRGVIPPDLPPILERLDIDAEAWAAGLHRRQLHGSVIGSAAGVAAEAARRGRKWLVNAVDLSGAGGERGSPAPR